MNLTRFLLTLVGDDRSDTAPAPRFLATSRLPSALISATTTRPTLLTTTTTTTAVTTDPPEMLVSHEREGNKVLDLSLHSLEEDGNPCAVPRVLVTFSQYRRTDTYFSMIFDSGSSTSYVLLHIPSTHALTYGYVNVTSPGSDDDHLDNTIDQLDYGSGNHTHSIPIVRRIRETVEIVGSGHNVGEVFSYGADLVLAADLHDDPGSGLLGAAWNSHFSRAAGIFTYVPSQDLAGPSPGTLVVGDRDWILLRAECVARNATSIYWYPIKPHYPAYLWLLDGSVSVLNGLGEGGAASFPANWAIDTGSFTSLVPEAAFAQLVSGISAAGGDVHSALGPDLLQTVTGCTTDSMARFPTLRFTIGPPDTPHLFTIELTPQLYLILHNAELAECQLTIRTGMVPDLPNVYVLGLVTLRHAITTFDRDHNRLGFCRM